MSSSMSRFPTKVWCWIFWHDWEMLGSEDPGIVRYFHCLRCGKYKVERF